MTKTTYILITILGVSFVCMILYINSWAGLSRGELFVSILFCFSLVSIAILFTNNSLSNFPWMPKSGYLRNYLIGLAIVFAEWMLISITLLPFIGSIGFELLGNKFFGIFWALLGLIAAPLARKYIK